MIGVLLHLGACALDDARECARDLAWVATFAAGAARLGLAAALDPEAARAVGEVAALRAQLLDETLRAEGWAHEANEAQAAASCAEGCLVDAQVECGALQADLEALRAAVRRHLAADTLDQAEPAWRALEALLPGEAVAAGQQTDLKAARLEYQAAAEACEQLRAELLVARKERDELRGLALNAIESRERLRVANGGGVATDSEAMVIRVDYQDAWAALVKAVKP